MPNIASALKAEISRIARKEVRAKVASLHKLAAAHRRDIALLNARVAELERLVGRLGTSAKAPKFESAGGM